MIIRERIPLRTPVNDLIRCIFVSFFPVLCCCGAKLVIPCTQDEFDVNAKACLMNEFFNTIKEKPNQDCR